MGSNLNFKSCVTDGVIGRSGGRPPGNHSLARELSIYSLTFDEFQSAVGGTGKDFGSMNMDELLKNIWSAGENQHIGSSSNGGGGSSSGQGGSGNLQRQGSLTLPRTLSQKTVDEVWRDISKDYGVGKDATGGVSGFNMQQKQPTLGEITIEEFLFKAGVAREETQLAVDPNSIGLLGDFSRVTSSSVLGFGSHEPQARGTAGLMGVRITESSNQRNVQSTNLPLNVNGVRTSLQEQLVSQPQPMQQAQPQQQQQILLKEPTLSYGAPTGVSNNEQLSPRIRGVNVGISDPATTNTMVRNATVHGGGLGMVGLGANGGTITTGSPALSSDGLAKSSGDTSSVSPTPYLFHSGLRGRRSAVLEKVVERRQRRMIKNRESAARSRARKQAYTMELEAEVAKLKEENEELRKRQAEILEMQKNQVLEMMNQQSGSKKRCLRRTQTGPW